MRFGTEFDLNQALDELRWQKSIGILDDKGYEEVALKYSFPSQFLKEMEHKSWFQIRTQLNDQKWSPISSSWHTFAKMDSLNRAKAHVWWTWVALGFVILLSFPLFIFPALVHFYPSIFTRLPIANGYNLSLLGVYIGAFGIYLGVCASFYGRVKNALENQRTIERELGIGNRFVT